MTHTFIKPLVVAVLLGMLPLTISSAYAVVHVKSDKGDLEKKDHSGDKEHDGKDAIACTPYHWGDTGPDGGIVFYVDGSGCHGLEAQAADASSGALMNWATAISTAAAYNTTAITGTLGFNCSTTSYPSLTAPPATPNCWHLPSKTELEYLYEQKTDVGGFGDSNYWSSTEDSITFAWYQSSFSGHQFCNPKTNEYRVRAVRAF